MSGSKQVKKFPDEYDPPVSMGLNERRVLPSFFVLEDGIQFAISK